MASLMTPYARPTPLNRRSAVINSSLLAVLVFTACGREQAGTSPTHHSEVNRRGLHAIVPEQGRLAGISWAVVSSRGDLRERAPELRRKALQDLGSEKDRRAAGGLRADAVIALLVGEMDQAIEKLSRAAEIVPCNAVVASDLAAARLQRGALLSDGEDFFRALISANHAVRLRPDLPEARFNRALALQRLSLYERARGEWDFYLRTERDPEWARAAKEHAAAITRILRRPGQEASLEAAQQAFERGESRRLRGLVAASPQLFREYAGGKLLVSWAEAEAGGHEREARRLLALARALGGALAGRGEHMAADTVSHIEALRRNDPAGLSRLVRAFQEYGRGTSRAEHADFLEAVSHFQSSHRAFAALRSPFTGWPTFSIAVCKYQHSEYADALRLLDGLSGKEVRDLYPALHGRARWLVGLIKIIKGDPTAAVNAYQAALDDFQRLGEATNGARVAAQVALGLDYLGRRNEAWKLIYAPLRELSTLDAPASRISICESASWLAKVEGEKEIALFFQEEAVRSAAADGTAYKVVLALKVRAEILAALGRKKAAERDLSVARQRLNDVPDLATRQSLASDIDLIAAQLASSPQDAISKLDDAIKAFRSTSYHYRLAEALSRRARAWEALGQEQQAERDLIEAISEFEQQRETISNPEQRASYYDHAREALDAMIWLQLKRRNRPEEAFGYSEQAKARALLDWVQIDPASSAATGTGDQATQLAIDPLSIRQSLPHGTTVVEYASLPQGLLIWTLRRDAFHTEKVPVERQTIEKLVHGLKDALEQGRRDDFLKASAALYELLIRPIEKHLPAGERIVAVPDGALHALPFALLQNSRTGRYLVQDHIGSIAPSARVFLASLRRDQKIANPLKPKALVVIDPAFDQILFSLPRLKTRKAKLGIADLFPGSLILEGHAATRRTFLGQAKEFEIVHFGGHSLVNSDYPLLSQMLFATEPDDPARGVLYSRDILEHPFKRTRLAVLASCSTAGGKISRTEGVESLARPFLAAGIPAVVAALWPVDNERSTEFLNLFYTHLKREFDPAAALQKAQVEWIGDGKQDPRVWGGFELVGGTWIAEAPRK
jgi:CHAT domain-containing protein